MTEQTKQFSLSNQLARERSREAADRTLMAWIRTALSLIGFGFAIAKYRDILFKAGLARPPQGNWSPTLVFGLSFIFLGILGLLAAVIQHWRILQHIKQDQFSYTGFRPLVFIVAILLLIIGVFAFIAVLT